MQSVGSATVDRSTRPRAPSLRNGNPGLTEEPKIDEDIPEDLPSGSLDPTADDSFSDEDLHDDEETGLTKKDKRRKKQKRRRNTLLDQRIARGGDITKEEKKEADQNVVKTLAINAGLILLWYIFSLSISLVSIQSVFHQVNDSRTTTGTDFGLYSITNGCSTRTGSTSPFPYLPRPVTCWSSLLWHH